MIISFLPTAHLALMSPEIPRIVNFTIFAAVLYFLLRKPIAQFFRDRAERISRELNKAQAEREEARARLQQIESRLSHLEDEIQELRARAAQEAEAEEARIRAAAERDAEKLRAMARRQIESSANAARIQLKAFVAAQVVELARSVIRRDMRDEDQHRLIEHFAEQIEEVRS
ncbi:MAG: ATP synthase F0 subunit B [Acidobacteria bacterium]|nr:ATP synthase F0 subunit B [Acidobacteriota bacterium]